MFVRTRRHKEELGCVFTKLAKENSKYQVIDKVRSLHVTVLLYSAFPTDSPYMGGGGGLPASPLHQLITTFIPPIVSVGAFNSTFSIS